MSEDLVRRLRDFAIDYNGAPMADGEQPLGTIHCKDLRDAANAIEILTAERDAALAEVTEEMVEKATRAVAEAAGHIGADCEVCRIYARAALNAVHERDAALKALELRQYQIDELRKSLEARPEASPSIEQIITFIISQDIHSWTPRILCDRIRAEFGKEHHYCPGCDSELEPDGKCTLCGVRWVERVGKPPARRPKHRQEEV